MFLQRTRKKQNTETTNKYLDLRSYYDYNFSFHIFPLQIYYKGVDFLAIQKIRRSCKYLFFSFPRFIKRGGAIFMGKIVLLLLIYRYYRFLKFIYFFCPHFLYQNLFTSPSSIYDLMCFFLQVEKSLLAKAKKKNPMAIDFQDNIILLTRKYLKHQIQTPDITLRNVFTFQRWLKRTVESRESNSALLVCPRSNGKRRVRCGYRHFLSSQKAIFYEL